MRLVYGSVIAVAFALCTSSLGAQAPASRTFLPEHFYNTFSFAHKPVLRIKPGDRVITRTIDARGFDDVVWNRFDGR